MVTSTFSNDRLPGLPALRLERARLDQIHPALDEQGRFTVGFDAADFHPDEWS
jgi:hypothetical protein